MQGHISVQFSWRNLMIGVCLKPVVIGRGAIIWIYPFPLIAIRIMLFEPRRKG